MFIWILNHDDYFHAFFYCLSIAVMQPICGRIFGLISCCFIMKFDLEFSYYSLFSALFVYYTQGFFKSVSSMNWLVKALAFINPTKYAFQLGILLEYRNKDDVSTECHLPEDFGSWCDPKIFLDYVPNTLLWNTLIMVFSILGVGVFSVVLFHFFFRQKNTRNLPPH